jgi:hypothetical protein
MMDQGAPIKRITAIRRITALAAAGVMLLPCVLAAAVGCSLNDPDRDVKRIFPQSTGYKTSFVSLKEKSAEPGGGAGGQQGAEAILKAVEAKLGDKLDPVYESADVPYAYYTVLKGNEIIGFVHGVNQKGIYGGMQVIIATDLAGKIVDFYYQKISSPEASKFRDKAFTQQFRGLTLDDFLLHDGQVKKDGARDRIAEIKDPSAKNHQDFLNTLRGIKKNLILLELLAPAETRQGKSESQAENEKEVSGE